MKKLISIFLFAYCFGAGGEEPKLYKIEGKTYSFQKKDEVYVSNCPKNCLALKSLLELKGKEISPQKTKGFAKSPAARACDAMEGDSLFGVDGSASGSANKDMMAFCHFRDDSLIEYASLEKLFKTED